eukprot:TRINITY_DN967_c0_g1_i4.p1 TRINITY_DN967_c0_g1~~TRINITY_DN967_c0_g1_i4.p1  ORF type:complete len:748 (-),score=175.53 TRINITY_DN967_c0_g1_i4:977-3220(-)
MRTFDIRSDSSGTLDISVCALQSASRFLIYVVPRDSSRPASGTLVAQPGPAGECFRFVSPTPAPATVLVNETVPSGGWLYVEVPFELESGSLVSVSVVGANGSSYQLFFSLLTQSATPGPGSLAPDGTRNNGERRTVFLGQRNGTLVVAIQLSTTSAVPAVSVLLETARCSLLNIPECPAITYPVWIDTRFFDSPSAYLTSPEFLSDLNPLCTCNQSNSEVVAALCPYAFPACDTSQLFVPLCSDFCEATAHLECAVYDADACAARFPPPGPTCVVPLNPNTEEVMVANVTLVVASSRTVAILGVETQTTSKATEILSWQQLGGTVGPALPSGAAIEVVTSDLGSALFAVLTDTQRVYLFNARITTEIAVTATGTPSNIALSAPQAALFVVVVEPAAVTVMRCGYFSPRNATLLRCAQWASVHPMSAADTAALAGGKRIGFSMARDVLVVADVRVEGQGGVLVFNASNPDQEPRRLFVGLSVAVVGLSLSADLVFVQTTSGAVVRCNVDGTSLLQVQGSDPRNVLGLGAVVRTVLFGTSDSGIVAASDIGGGDQKVVWDASGLVSFVVDDLITLFPEPQALSNEQQSIVAATQRLTQVMGITAGVIVLLPATSSTSVNIVSSLQFFGSLAYLGVNYPDFIYKYFEQLSWALLGRVLPFVRHTFGDPAKKDGPTTGDEARHLNRSDFVSTLVQFAFPLGFLLMVRAAAHLAQWAARRFGRARRAADWLRNMSEYLFWVLCLMGCILSC